MRSRSVLIPLVLGILLNLIPNAQATEPDFKDFYLPIIEDLKIKPVINVQTEPNGKFRYVTQLAVDLKVRVHHNSLSGFRVYYEGPRSTVENLCQSIQTFTGLRISVGNTEYSGGEGSLTVLQGLNSRVKDGDWYLETYSLTLSVPSNQNFFPCEGTNRVVSIFLRDVAGRYKQFLDRSDGLPVPSPTSQPDVVSTSFNLSGSQYRAQLSEYGCPKVVGGEWGGAPLRCVDRIDPPALSITFTSNDKTAADKTAADKAAADKAAADKAAADKAAANKKTTITCVKGKLTKKVTAVKPKCPTGYKIKK